MTLAFLIERSTLAAAAAIELRWQRLHQ